MRLALLTNGHSRVVAIEEHGAFYRWGDSGRVRPAESILDLIRSGELLASRGAEHATEPIATPVEVLAPFPNPPRNIICLGKNYAAHAEEFSESMEDSVELSIPEVPIFFTKAPTTVRGPDATITVDPGVTSEVDYEVELAVVIGERARDVAPEDAHRVVAGYTIINDLTARDLQRQHKQWFLGKSVDGFCPMGPVFVTADEFAFPPVLALSLKVDGEVRQSASTADMVFDIPNIIATLSRVMTLVPGDIIATGTPGGVGVGSHPPRFLTDGSVVEAAIEGIGVLRNTIRFESRSKVG